MDAQALPSGPLVDSAGIKRKRSSSVEIPISATPATHAPPPAKSVKTHGSNPNVNYLSRAYTDTLSLIDQRDSLRTILDLLNDYVSVMERHESLASNLGAKPLGPMLMKRFERLFDERPRILKSNSKDNASVTWLDVVEFARHKPEQFNLEKQRDGVKVCQFYTKMCRVEISEEDFLLISSGMPQKLIPPQPIPEDEDKELATIEILERGVGQVASLAEQVQAKIRSFKARLSGRKNAISNRRLQEMATEPAPTTSDIETPGSPASGFTAVNRQPVTNGSSANGRSPAIAAPLAVRAELETLFANIREGIVEGSPPAAPRPHINSKVKSKNALSDEFGNSTASPVAIPNTPHNLVNHQRPSQIDRYDDSGPFKAEMLSRMEQLNRGDRVVPPCDRCRRLHMDCQKNLTACQGCTRKHAKCSWKEVTDQELLDNPRPQPKDQAASMSQAAPQPEGPPQPVRDEELLGEDDSGDDTAPVLPKIEPVENIPLPSKEDSLPPFSSSRVNSSPARETHLVQPSHEEVSARAREILNNRMADVPGSASASPGFATVSRDLMDIQPGRMHQPLPAISTAIPNFDEKPLQHTMHIPHGGSSPATNPPTVPQIQKQNGDISNDYRGNWGL